MNTAPAINPHAQPFTMTVCWCCGNPKPRNGASYCTHCKLAGLDSPWINCTGCGAARRRNVPGERVFTCTRCKEQTA